MALSLLEPEWVTEHGLSLHAVLGHTATIVGTVVVRDGVVVSGSFLHHPQHRLTPA